MTPLHSLVEEVLQNGTITFPNGEVFKAHSYIPRNECELLYRVVATTRARQGVEIGMAFGVSTLCLCDTLQRNGHTSSSLVVIDPHQSLPDGWMGVGIRQVERAGFRSIVELHEKTSQEVLPLLKQRDLHCQVAFIDGWHTFDHALVDFFYVDTLLETNGIVVLDDVGYPAINAVARFILSNRDYELIETVPTNLPIGSGLRARGLVKSWLTRLIRTDRTPRPEHAALFKRLENVQAVALKKRSADVRRFDDFCAF